MNEKKIDTGGSAFPRPMSPLYPGDLNLDRGAEGMTVRTWLAGQVISGFWANSNLDVDIPTMARIAVEQADALLEELNRKEES